MYVPLTFIPIDGIDSMILFQLYFTTENWNKKPFYSANWDEIKIVVEIVPMIEK